MALGCVSRVSNVHHLHDDGTLLTPDALGGVLGLHVGGHAILHGARDVLLDHEGTVVPAGTQRRDTELWFFFCVTVHPAHTTHPSRLIKGITVTSRAHCVELDSIALAAGEKVIFKSVPAPPALMSPKCINFQRDGCQSLRP